MMYITLKEIGGFNKNGLLRLAWCLQEHAYFYKESFRTLMLQHYRVCISESYLNASMQGQS